jgi:hypothetical protein
LDSLDKTLDFLVRIVEVENDIIPLLAAQSQRTLKILLKRVKTARKLGIIDETTFRILHLLISRRIID